MSAQLSLIQLLTLASLAGGIFLLVLIDLKWGVFLLTFASIGNVLLEQLLPVKLDIILGVVILMVFFAKFAVYKSKWKRSILDLPVVILISAGILTLAVQAFRGSEFFSETANQFASFFAIMLMALVIVQILTDHKAIGSLLQIFVVTVGFISLLTVLALALDIPSLRIGDVELTLFHGWGGIKARLGGIYQQPNIFATLLVLAFPLGVVFALVNRGKTKRLFWIGMSIICAGALFLSQSRSAILGGIAGLIVMVILFIRSRAVSTYATIWNSLLIGFGVIAILWATGMLNFVLERLTWEYYVYQQATDPAPRLEIWREAFLLALRNPLGYGAETSYLVGQSLGLERMGVHNVFLGFLNSWGVLGFIGVLVLALASIKGLWRLTYTSKDWSVKVLSAGLIAGLVGLWVHNLAHSIIHWIAVWIYFACVAGMLRYDAVNAKKEQL